MTKKQIFGSSIILTLFILGGIIGVTRAASNDQTGDEISPELYEQIEAREAAYNDLINEANQQIEDLNSQVAALQDGSSIISGEETITAQEAVNFARESLNEDDYLLDIPQLATYQDQTIFTVNFTSGTVYVNAFNGEIVFSNVPQKIDEQQAIAIAAEYLGISDQTSANVQSVELEGSSFFKVNISSYVVYIDAYGNITKVQSIQYASPSTSSSSSSSNHDDHHDDDDDEHEDDDD
jgi:TolA-binding protein